jgi:Spy/CpxP family protein refolding chaperone
MRFAIWGLKLSDEQRKKAQEIFQAAARQQRTLHEQLWEKQKAYADAKPGTDAEIDKRVAERAELMAKIEATHEKAFANFYNNVLTAEQRTQYDKLREARRAGGPGAGFCPGRGRGHGMMGGPGMGWGPRPGFGHGFGPGMGWEPGWGQGWRPGW